MNDSGGKGWTIVARHAAALTFVCATPGHAQATAADPLPASSSASDRANAAQCLTAAIGYEAGNEPLAGQQAVAEVILNRVRHPGYPKTVCGVVFQGSDRHTGCQFTFTCDGSMLRHQFAAARYVSWRAVADAALDGLNPSRVPGATHYHADYVSPYWAPSLIRVAKLGAHIFYRPPSGGDPTLLPGFIGGTPPVSLAGQTNFAGGFTSAPPPRPAKPAVFAPWGLTPVTH